MRPRTPGRAPRPAAVVACPRFLAGLLLAGLLLPAGRAHAFSEDLCVRGGRLVDCLEAEHCAQDSGGDSAVCRANVVWDAARVTALENGRSVLHTDATYFIGVALGLRRDVAYWIAAYDQATDLGQYVPFDMYGRTMTRQERWHTAEINGWQRTNAVSGGLAYHFVTVDAGAAGSGTLDGAHPQLDGPGAEGLLVHVRDWALYGAQARPPCAAGLTERAADGGYHLGRRCYPESASAGRSLQGTIPSFSGLQGSPVETIPFSGLSGRQIALYAGTPARVSRVLAYADGLQALLDRSSGRIGAGANRRPVPEALARFGIWLHVLQDRISHHECGDASAVGGPNGRGRFVFRYSVEQCTQDLHAWRHYEELGQTPLPERTLSALESTYDELAAFRAEHEAAHPEWFAGAPVASRAELVRDASGNPGVLARVLQLDDGCRRAQAMIQALAAAGLPQMPGNSAARAAGMCPAP